MPKRIIVSLLWIIIDSVNCFVHESIIPSLDWHATGSALFETDSICQQREDTLPALRQCFAHSLHAALRLPSYKRGHFANTKNAFAYPTFIAVIFAPRKSGRWCLSMTLSYYFFHGTWYNTNLVNYRFMIMRIQNILYALCWNDF